MQLGLIFAALVIQATAVPTLHYGGWRNVSPLIVGGRPAQQGEVPYQLSLRYENTAHCGASVVEVQGLVMAITAAHCVPDFIPIESLTVVAGDVSLSDSTGIEQIRKLTKIVSHEGFNQLTYENDIALLFIDEPFELNENVQTIALPEAGIPTAGELLVSGWGKLEYEGSIPDILQIVEVPVVSDDACQEAFADLGDEIFDTVICAGYLGEGGKDACQGDSGGAAKSIDGNYLAGVVSWGEGCADPRYPGIYTEVSHFIEWINNNVASYLQHKNVYKISVDWYNNRNEEIKMLKYS